MDFLRVFKSGVPNYCGTDSKISFWAKGEQVKIFFSGEASFTWLITYIISQTAFF